MMTFIAVHLWKLVLLSALTLCCSSTRSAPRHRTFLKVLSKHAHCPLRRHAYVPTLLLSEEAVLVTSRRSEMTASSWCVSSCARRRSCRRNRQLQSSPLRYKTQQQLPNAQCVHTRVLKQSSAMYRTIKILSHLQCTKIRFCALLTQFVQTATWHQWNRSANSSIEIILLVMAITEYIKPCSTSC